MNSIEKFRDVVQYERDWTRAYVRGVDQGRYASQPEWVHMIRLRIHASRIAAALAALYRAHRMAEQMETAKEA